MAKPDDPEARKAAEVSRRDFLRGTGAVISAGIVASAEVLEASPADTKIVGPDKVSITLRINGAAKSLSLEPRVTLLEALRNELELTGAKKVCDRSTCGACTVIINGKAAYSCTVLALEAQGKEITTVEGLAQGGKLHTVQQAFVDKDARQFGCCSMGCVCGAE